MEGSQEMLRYVYAVHPPDLVLIAYLMLPLSITTVGISIQRNLNVSDFPIVTRVSLKSGMH